MTAAWSGWPARAATVPHAERAARLGMLAARLPAQGRVVGDRRSGLLRTRAHTPAHAARSPGHAGSVGARHAKCRPRQVGERRRKPLAGLRLTQAAKGSRRPRHRAPSAATLTISSHTQCSRTAGSCSASPSTWSWLSGLRSLAEACRLARAAAILAVIGGSCCGLLQARAALGAGWHGGAVRPGQEKQRRIASGGVPKRAGKVPAPRVRAVRCVRSMLLSCVAGGQNQCAGRANPSTVEEITRLPPQGC